MAERVGYRFHPTDDELVDYFLRHKIDGRDSRVDDDVRFIEIRNFDPWELPEFAPQGSNDQVWYFFYRREQLNKTKKTNKPRYNRSTKKGTGHWKPTGDERLVKAKRSERVIGIKRTLVFYARGSPKEVRTNWVIHEYENKNSPPHQADLVLCKLKEKSNKKTDTSACNEGESSHSGPSHLDNNPIEIPVFENESLLLESLLANNPGANFDDLFVQQQQFHMDQGLSIDDFLPDDVFDNGSNGMELELDRNESEEDPNEMADSFLEFPDEYSDENYLYTLSIDHGGYNHEQTGRTHLSHSSSLQPLSGVYLDDMDAEIVNEEHSQFGIANLDNNHAASKEYRQTRRVVALTETLPPSTYEQSTTAKVHVHGDGVVAMKASSANSTTYRDEEIKPVGGLSVKRFRSRAGIQVAKEVAPRKLQLQGNYSPASKQKAKENAPVNEPQNAPKESMMEKTEKDRKMISAEASLKLRTNERKGNNKTGSFIRMETPLLSQKGPSPPSVYVVNVFFGLILLLAAARELLILH